MEKAIVIALLLLALAILVSALALRRAIEDLRRDPHLPFRLRSGLDDLSAPFTRRRIFLRQVRDLLEDIDDEQAAEQRIMAEIRNGTYDPEEPAFPRKRSGRKESSDGRCS